MSCIITYKGNKYTQEQFKEYISSNKNEFSHIIASNKNVIDSFKRKMEGINYVFSQSPELASIGTKAQYLQYLSTIFKTSKVKDIVYHGTDRKIENEKFKKSRDGAYGTGIYFDSFDNAKGLAEFIGDRRGGSPNVIAAIVNIAKFGEKDGDGIKEGTEVKVNEPEQIHILSSKKDLEMFRNFINFTKSEYAKYGDIQQFRDYIMSKNFAAIEEFLVVNNKIDRKC